MTGTITRAPLAITTICKDRSRSRFAASDPSISPADTLRQRLRSPSSRNALNLISIVAPTTINVLVQGGLDTDRLLIAETIHNMSNRRLNAFIKVDCASLSSVQIETELFGYASRTRLRDQQPTCFTRAFRGTLFLNDIEFIPRTLQRRLLDVLRHRQVPPTSSKHSTKIDMRLIAASGQNLAELVKRSFLDNELHNLLRIFPIDMTHVEPETQFSN